MQAGINMPIPKRNTAPIEACSLNDKTLQACTTTMFVNILVNSC